MFTSKFGKSSLRDIKMLESVQKRAMKPMKALENNYYEEQLRKLKLFGLKKRRLREDLMPLYSCLKEGCREVDAGLFPQAMTDRTRRKCIK